MHLIVGLGNPGKRYEKTRHNIGFLVLDALVKKEAVNNPSISWKLSKKHNAEIAEIPYKNNKVLLAKPMTYMNDSGQSVNLLLQYFKIPKKNLLVVHDEKDLPLGTNKVQTDRGAAGHNGITSIMQHIGTQKFTRIRIGIASKNEKKMANTAQFVLGKFGLFEKKLVQESIEGSIQKIYNFLS